MRLALEPTRVVQFNHTCMYSFYFYAGSLQFFIKQLMKKEHDNSQEKLILPEKFSKMLIKFNGIG